MNYFDVNFSYNFAKRGVTAGGDGVFVHLALSVDENAESRALFDADKAVTEALEKAGIEFKHSYMYPDGSLYKRIRTELSKEELDRKLCELLPQHKPDAFYEISEKRFNHVGIYPDDDEPETQMNKEHKKFFKQLHALCAKYKVALWDVEVRFTENMPDTDELTGHYKLSSMHAGGMSYKELPLQTNTNKEDYIDMEF